jgi:hypothetical protein
MVVVISPIPKVVPTTPFSSKILLDATLLGSLPLETMPIDLTRGCHAHFVNGTWETHSCLLILQLKYLTSKWSWQWAPLSSKYNDKLWFVVVMVIFCSIVWDPSSMTTRSVNVSIVIACVCKTTTMTNVSSSSRGFCFQGYKGHGHGFFHFMVAYIFATTMTQIVMVFFSITGKWPWVFLFLYC